MEQSDIVWLERKQFRYYSRLVVVNPAHSEYHRQRIAVATNLNQSELLQGALADYFFACWYDMATVGVGLLDSLVSYLPKHIIDLFRGYIATGEYITSISILATRFSVLVSPSMNVPSYKLYVSRDDAKRLSKQASSELLQARYANDKLAMTNIQSDYLKHCLACQDRMGFMMTWFNLSKYDWDFDEHWLQCRQLLADDVSD